MAEICCKHCESSDCHGCNMYLLEQMLKAGDFDSLMNETRTIKLDADVAPVRKGKWKKVIDAELFAIYECSACGRQSLGYGRYCPNCGAKMDKVNE